MEESSVRETYIHPVHLRWSDEDRNGHVNNSKFMTYTEDARIAWLGVMRAQTGAGPGSEGVILASLHCEYKAQVHFAHTKELEVLNTVRRIGSSSVELHQTVQVPGAEVVADLITVLVSFDYDAGRAAPWGDEQRAWLGKYVEGVGDAAAV
nr:thioesterase family protein [Antricoccus suffuscus]